jgi:hypothetical protein
MQKMTYPAALQYKINCGNRFLKTLSTWMSQYKDVYHAIVDNQALLDEVCGLAVEFYELGEPREYAPKDYLTD